MKCGPVRAASQPLFRYYDREALDKQYQVGATVPNLAEILQEYERLSRQARENLACHLAIRYGPTPPERLDIFPVAEAMAAPVLVYFHGGYWRALDSSDSAFMAETFTRGGICVVAVNYALAPGVTLDEIVRQCRAAVLWVADNIARYGGDPGQIHIAGSSAGAHLAAMVGSETWGDAFDRPPPPLASLTLLSGIYDLSVIRLTFVNAWLSLDAEDAHRNSPINFLPSPRLPIIASYGENEPDEFKRQTESYISAVRTIGCDVEFVAVPDANHFDLVLSLCHQQSPVASAAFQLIRSVSP